MENQSCWGDNITEDSVFRNQKIRGDTPSDSLSNKDQYQSIIIHIDHQKNTIRIAIKKNLASNSIQL